MEQQPNQERAPESTTQGRRNRLLGKLLVLLMVTASFGYGWFVLDYEVFLETPLILDANGVDFTISSGTTLKRVAAELGERGVLDQPYYLEWYARWHKLAHRIQAGEYHIPSGITPPELLQLIVDGRVTQHAITLIEGWSFREMMATIERNELLHHTLNEADQKGIMAAIGHPEQHPEGRFFPDTYHITRGTSDIDLLKRAYRRMEQRLDAAWHTRDKGLPLRSRYEALILASIVEKETGVAEERPEIAGVFVRRLQKRMRLQTDPTVIYGIGESFDGNIRSRDLRTDTPYNTYTRHGLPPTPIAMPSGAAIDAVMHPANGKSLYFVARGDGSHYFSATLEEHNRAVRKYQLGKKQERDDAR